MHILKAPPTIKALSGQSYKQGKKTEKISINSADNGREVLGKLPVLGRPANLEYSRARAYRTCSRCGLELFGHFFSRLSFLSLWETARYRRKYCLKGGPLHPKQPINQSAPNKTIMLYSEGKMIRITRI